ncbi:Protein unc-80 [Sparganum proliferum]
MPILAFRQPYEGSFPVLVKPCGDVDISPLCTYVEQFGPVPEAFRHLDFESATGVLQFPPTTAECGSAGVARIKGETPETLLTPVTSFYPTSPSLNIPNAESSDEETSWYDRNAPPVGVSGLRARDLKSAVPMAHLNEICPVSLKETDSSESSTSEADNGNNWDHSHLDQSLEEQVAEFTQTVLKDIMATDTRMASHTDLAVIRCLFTAEWSESGAVWALQYIYRRLVFLRHESLQERLKRNVQSRLFHSRLPYYAHLCNDYTLSQGLEMGILRSLSTPQLSIFPPSCQQSMDADSVSSLQGHKKTQGVFEDGALPKSQSDDRGCTEAPGGSLLAVPRSEASSRQADSGSLRNKGKPPHPKSACDLVELHGREESMLIQFKSQSSLIEKRGLGDLRDSSLNEDDSGINCSQISIEPGDFGPASPDIITSSQRSLIHRSYSDTNIAYNSMQLVEEVPGSNNYIDADGGINYSTLLTGIYWTSNLHSSLRICEHLLKNVYCLLDLCYINWNQEICKYKAKKPSGQSEKKCDDAVTASSFPSVSRLSAVQLPVKFDRLLKSRPSSRSKSVIAPSFLSTPASQHTPKRPHSRPRGSSALLNRDGENSSERLDTLERSNRSSRRLPFNIGLGRQRQRKTAGTEEAAAGEAEADLSNDNESTDDDGQPTAQTTRQQPHTQTQQQKQTRYRLRSTFLSHRKHGDDKFVFSSDTSQVRFRTSTPRSVRGVVGTGQHGSRRSMDRLSDSPSLLGASLLRLSSGQLAVEKRPRRVNMEGRGTYNGNCGGRAASFRRDEKLSAQAAAKRQESVLNYCLIMEILVNLSARNSLWPSTSTKRNSGFLSSVDPPDTTESLIGSFQAKRMGFLSSAVGSQFPKPRRLTDEAVSANMDVKAGKLVVERKLVDISALREDLLDFSFLLECSEPGSLPESELVASFLDLNAPVLARACLLLQCAYFVNKCNRGEWPAWMKMNFPMPVQQATHTNLQPPAQPIAISISGPTATSGVEIDNRGVRIQKNTAQIQWAAGRLFHAWAEALGIRIMEFLDNPANVTSSDAFLHRDFGHEENFLDDALVNASGENCPYALLVLAVQLLMEITAFLRESHQHALRGGGGRNPRGHSEVVVQSEGHGAQMSGRRSHTSGLSGHQGGAGAAGASSALKATRRRLSILMPLFGPMESKEKATPQGGNSYIELPDVRTENTETGVSARIAEDNGGHRMSIRISESKDQGAQSPYHEGNTDDGFRSGLRPESARKRDRLNDTDQDDISTSQLKRSPRRERLKTSLSSTATPIGSRSRTHTPTDSCSTNMPWIPAVIKFAKLTNFSCRHQPTCQVNCFDRQQQQLRALLQAIRQVYSAPTETSFIASVDKLPEGRRLHSTPSAHSGPIWHQYSSDSARTCEVQSIRSSPNNSSNNSAGSSEVENATGSDLRISEQDARGALKEACLRLGGAGFVDLGLDFGDSETDVSTSILHRVFAATGVECDKKNGLQVKAAKRKESSMLTTGWKEATTPIFDRFRRKGGHKRASAGLNGAALYCGPEEGSLQAGQGGLSSLMNLSLLAGAGTGLAAAASSPSLARLLEFVKSGLGGASELEEGQSEDDMPRTKVRPPMQNADSPELVYLDTQVHSLRSSFFNLLNKSAILLTNEQLEDIIPLAWELLLEADPELTSSAATFILFAAVKCPNFVQKLVYTELHHADVNNRLNAVLRFRILWVNRHHVWSRLEEGAALCFKLPPPSIEYVLPSPTLGNPTVEVPDPAWKTRKGTSAEEVQLKQNEATKTFVTASTSRRKQQQELLARAVSAAKAQEDEARRAFHMTTCPVLELASIEAAFSKDHREEASGEDGTVGVTNSVVQEEFNLAARKVSFAPLNRSMNMQSRSFSWRNGSIPIFRDNVTLMDDDESSGGGLTLLCTHQFQMAQCFFPSCLCAAALPLTDLLDDCAVSREGTAISTVAQEVIWQCLTEDTSLFLRNIFEKLTRAPHKDELICILRKLVQRLPELPMQTAHILFNNLVGCIMFYVRTPNFDAPDSIASVLCILHMIVPFVKNIYFKDLKQTLRREQIDGTLLVTANLPCAKQFNVFDDRICVAQLVKLQDDNKDYRFSDILSEALETNSVPQSEHHLHVLCDDRSNIIRNSSHYVRDFYPFKRNHIPKLRLMRVDKETGQQLLQRNAFSLKVQEVGKVMLFKTILQTTPMSTMSNHLMFLHEELVKLPSFPRKALETEFALCDTGEMAKPLLAIDTIHKLTWCQLLNSMFQKMPSTFPWSSELQLFLNVYNGTLVLHAEDASILRHCMAFYLQCAYQFKMVFSVNGYLSILPTIIRVYHHNLHNGILTQAIEFTCKHFYIMHRTPFILQMFGCIANYIDLSQDDFSQQNFYRKFGCPERFTRMQSQLHHVMMAHITGNSAISEAFAVTDRVRQGCLLVPILFNLMLFVMLMGAYRDDRPGIRIDYGTNGHLLNSRRMQTRTRLPSTTIHDLLFTDECALNSMTEIEMRRSMDLFSSGCAHFGLTINTDKTVVMHQQPSNTEYSVPRIRVNSNELKTVNKSNYLGSTMPRRINSGPPGSQSQPSLEPAE